MTGTALSAKEAVKRTIQALARKDGFELVLVAPTLALPERSSVTVPNYKITGTQSFNSKLAEDWNNLSLQPPVQSGDILIRTAEKWADPKSTQFAYLVRESDTGWVVLSRAPFRKPAG